MTAARPTGPAHPTGPARPGSAARSTRPSGTWTVVCPLEGLTVERGAAALVNGQAVAVFRTHDGSVYALGNHDPFSKASVLARGIVGTRTVDGEGEVPFVASPMHKQAFDLRTGRCLDDESVSVPAYAVRVVDGMVHVGPRLSP